MRPRVARTAEDQHGVQPGIEVRSVRDADDRMACRVEAEQEEFLAGTVDPCRLRPGGRVYQRDAVEQTPSVWQLDPCRRCVGWRRIRPICPPNPHVAAAD